MSFLPVLLSLACFFSGQSETVHRPNSTDSLTFTPLPPIEGIPYQPYAVAGTINGKPVGGVVLGKMRGTTWSCAGHVERLKPDSEGGEKKGGPESKGEQPWLVVAKIDTQADEDGRNDDPAATTANGGNIIHWYN